jgi:hypothetical protein
VHRRSLSEIGGGGWEKDWVLKTGKRDAWRHPPTEVGWTKWHQIEARSATLVFWAAAERCLPCLPWMAKEVRCVSAPFDSITVPHVERHPELPVFLALTASSEMTSLTLRAHYHEILPPHWALGSPRPP